MEIPREPKSSRRGLLSGLAVWTSNVRHIPTNTGLVSEGDEKKLTSDVDRRAGAQRGCFIQCFICLHFSTRLYGSRITCGGICSTFCRDFYFYNLFYSPLFYIYTSVKKSFRKKLETRPAPSRPPPQGFHRCNNTNTDYTLRVR